MRVTNIGGQGVLEGIMLRSPEISALAVRKANGEIVYKKKQINTKKRNWFLRLPVIRGVIAFVDTLVLGTATLFDSAKMYDESLEEEPSKFEAYIAKKTGKDAMSVMMAFAVVIAIGLAILLFFILPTLAAGFFKGLIQSIFLLNLVEGLVRIIILIAYIVGVSFLKDIKRVFMYHGAEHKTINCYEHEQEITVENIKKHKKLHPRCGTSYLFFIVVISILVFSLVDWSSIWYIKIGLRLLLLPIVAGLAYELLKFCGKHENWFLKIIRFPGMMLQKITTKEPDDDMIEVAVIAFKLALNEQSEEEIILLAKEFSKKESLEQANAS